MFSVWADAKKKQVVICNAETASRKWQIGCLR
jgi:hypothetical protein